MRAALLALAALLLVACGRKPADPETAVRATITAIEEAVEARDLDAVLERLAPGFRGNGQQTAQQVRGTLQAVFLRQRSIHALVRVSELSFPTPDLAVAKLRVAVAGTPLPEDGLLDGLNADLIDVDLQLRLEDGAWKATSARWSGTGDVW